MYKIKKSPNGKWIVRWNDSVVYAADTKRKAQEYIERMGGVTKKGVDMKF